MIPIGLPSYELVLTALACLVTTLIWLGWILRLAFGQRAGSRLRGWRGAVFLLLSGITLWSIWSVYALSRAIASSAAEYRANYLPVLEQSQTLGGIDMPPGTRLHLALARELNSFQHAEFPHPVAIAGVDAVVAERYLSIHTDESYMTSGFTPQNLRLTGIGTSLQSGWLCDAGGVIVFATDAEGVPRTFESCRAATRNMIEDSPLPGGSEIIATEGSLFPDGRRGQDRWLIHLPTDGAFMIRGTEQTGGVLLLDIDRRVISHIPQ